MKKFLQLLSLSLIPFVVFIIYTKQPTHVKKEQKKGLLTRTVINPTKKGKKLTLEERALFDEARNLHDFYLQANPFTGNIPREEKELERLQAERSPKAKNGRNLTVSLRGPNNLGGRTRALVVDVSDATGNTIIAGAVSGGVFRTTNGGTTWTRVSDNNEIHNVTTIAQDPRPGFQNIWYYGTGETSGNSAGQNGSFYLGRGIWKSTDSGLTWTQVAGTNSAQELF